MDRFLKQKDLLANIINEQAVILYNKLRDIDVHNVKLSEWANRYFNQFHVSRLYFSIQTSCELLYRSIKLKNKSPQELIIMDYGAGMGSLFLLAKMIGIKKVIYNDYFSETVKAGEILCKIIGVPVDYFIIGDHSVTFSILKEKEIFCDIILSRNVVEHIYDLKDFYQQAKEFQPDALIYFSTTANYHNPINRLYHRGIHKKYEKRYLQKRAEIIKNELPEISKQEMSLLAEATRGLAMDDLSRAIKSFKTRKVFPNPNIHYSNTVNPENGVWAEHVIKKQDYKRIIEPIGYKLSVLPAFWDTHYKKAYKRMIGKTMNFLTRIFGKEQGLWFTAFIYIIAEPKGRSNKCNS